MNYITCGSLSIPLPLVQAISWTKTAKTVEKKGGFVSARGFEPAEISARIVLNNAVCAAFDLSFREIMEMLSALVPSRLAPSSTFRVAGFPIYPELEFALTNCNRTTTADHAGGISAMELDLVFSGVSRAKEVSRERALQMARAADIPHVTLSVGAASLSVQDGLAIVEMRTEPDSIHLVIECGMDLDLVSRDDFLEKFTENGLVTVQLPTGQTAFHVISAFLVGNELAIDGAIYPSQAQRYISQTWYDSDISEIVPWLFARAGVECDCRASGAVDYYHADGSPLFCIKDFLESAGLVVSYRQGRATVAFLPDNIAPQYNLEYISMRGDDGVEPISGCVWDDGVNRHVTGQIDASTLRIRSCFRSSADYSARCLALAAYRRNRVVVGCDIDPRIDSHSVVSVVSNDSIVNCLVSWYIADWVENTHEIELNWLGAWQ